MPNIFIGDLNFQIIDWQMETADGGIHENQVQANAFLQFAQEQWLQQNIEEPTRKNITYLRSFSLIMTNSPVGTGTSMSDHNIIQIETNMKIIEEKQNCQIKKSNLSYRDLIFFNEDISWASIDADLLNTSWDMLLTDVKTDEMYNIINICVEICKKYVLPKKSPRKHQISTVYFRISTVYLSKFLRSTFECKVDRRNVFISFPISYGC